VKGKKFVKIMTVNGFERGEWKRVQIRRGRFKKGAKGGPEWVGRKKKDLA